MKTPFDFFICILLFYLNPLSAFLDLSEMVQGFVLETKRIHIPGYPYAFNPSIIRWQGAFLMSFRDIPNPKNNFESQLGLIWLDDNFNPISSPQILDTQGNSLIPSRSEDPRLIKVGARLYMVYSDNKDEKITRGGFRVYIAELKFDGRKFFLYKTEGLNRFEGESNLRREKNWVPFDFEGNLLLAYSLTPHLIFRPLIGQGECETLAKTHNNIQWDWGTLRGGTPAVILDNGNYLSFFHSSQLMETKQSEGKSIPHYFMGAYTFSSIPPFEIISISSEPIIGKTFYDGVIYKPYWSAVRVVFPGGFVFDDNYIWIAYGRQDHETWVVKLDKKLLYESLIPVKR